MHDLSDLAILWQTLILPLAKLLGGMSAGLFLAVFIEYMGWSRVLSVALSPLARLGHLGGEAAAAFGVAFISPAAANGLLSEAWRSGKMGRRELTLANICNSLPASLAHLPMLFLLAWPAIGPWALALVGINLAVGAARSFLALIAGRLVLPKPGLVFPAPCAGAEKDDGFSGRMRSALCKSWKKFRKRLLRLAFFTIPLFILIWLARQHGLFEIARSWLLENLDWASFLEPAGYGIVLLQLLAETGASLGAAGALLDSGAISGHQVVAALLLGGLLATPLRAIRHQLPALAGFFNPGMALWLTIVNQGTRALLMALALLIFF